MLWILYYTEEIPEHNWGMWFYIGINISKSEEFRFFWEASKSTSVIEYWKDTTKNQNMPDGQLFYLPVS